MLLLSVVVLLCTLTFNNAQTTRLKVIFEWNYINYSWPNEDQYANAIKTSKYVPENSHISGVKVFEDYLYVTTPRMKEGIPSTLNRIPFKTNANPENYDTSPLLEPYPSWEMNLQGDCNALQNVQNVEIDPNGLIWILDIGRTATITRNPNNKCQPRLVIYDIKSNKLVKNYIFPQEVTNNGSFLYDLVLDDVDGGYAYITDNSGPDPAIIVYSLKLDRAWIIRDEKSMKAEEEATHFTVNGTGVTASINIAGIALGPRHTAYGQHDTIYQDRIVYYCALSSYTLYSVNSAVLRDERSATNGIANHVKVLGKKASQTDGMIMDENGVLYYGLLADNSIAKWDSKTPFTTMQKIIAKDKTYIQWPDSLSIDTSGNLLVVTNKLQKYIFGRMNLTEPNFRILQGFIGARSYLYSGLHLDDHKHEPEVVMMNQTTPNIRTSMRNTTESTMHMETSSFRDNLYYETHSTQNQPHSAVQPQVTEDVNHPVNSATIYSLNMLWLCLAIVLILTNK